MCVRFILNKKIGVGQPKVIENAKILIANTAMDTDKIKIYGSRVRVDSMNKVRAGGASMCLMSEVGIFVIVVVDVDAVAITCCLQNGFVCVRVCTKVYD